MGARWLLANAILSRYTARSSDPIDWMACATASLILLYAIIIVLTAIHVAEHEVPGLYKYHQKHHEVKSTTGIALYCMTPLEVQLNFVLPVFVPFLIYTYMCNSWFDPVHPYTLTI